MLHLLKSMIRNSFLYRHIWKIRANRFHKLWTSHDDRMLQFYSGFVKPGQLCFDIGANIGNRSKILLKLGARVVAVEPQPPCITVLQHNLGKHPNMFIEPVALGSDDGSGTLLINRGTTVSSMSPDWVRAVRESGRFGDEQWSNSIEVPITTLEKLIKKHGVPVFIKIDVEGFEKEVVHGLCTKIPMISIEFTPEILDTTYSAIEHLLGLGQLEFNLSIGENMWFEKSVWCNFPALQKELQQYIGTKIFGDVYIRLLD